MFSKILSRCASCNTVYQISVKCAHKSTGHVVRRRQRSLALTMQENDEFRQEMLEDAEKIEDIHDWIEKNMQRPDFVEKMASEEEKLRRKIKYMMIERKYFNKPQELNLLTWDAKEQIRFLHAEYPDEWTVDRLIESFPISREGVIKILNSSFHPMSLGEIVKHDQRVQKHWKELKNGKSKGLLNGGPVAFRYQELLKNAAGNPSLPMPDLNTLLLNSGKVQQTVEKPGIFLSIVKDYCDKKQLEAMTDGQKKVPSSDPSPSSQLDQHIVQNRKLAHHLVNKSVAKVLKLPQTSQEKSFKALKAEASVSNFVNYEFTESSLQSKKSAVRPRLLIDSDFDYSQAEEELLPQKSHLVQQAVLEGEQKVPGNFASNAGLKDTKKLSKQDDSLRKMEENSKLAADLKRTTPRKVLDAKIKAAMSEMMAGRSKDDEIYMFSEEKGYQHPFGRKKNLPDERIQIPKGKTKSRPGVVYVKDGDYYDEDGEFLYRAP